MPEGLHPQRHQRRRGAKTAAVLQRVLILVLLGCDQGGLDLRPPPAMLVDSSPADGEVNVDRRPVLRLRYDRRLAPTTVSRGTIALRSAGVGVRLSVRYDPVRGEAIAVPTSTLVEGVVYRLQAEGFRDLDGIEAEPARIEFVTGANADGTYEVGTTSWEDVREFFSTRCASAGCHTGEAPPLGLDFSSAEGVERTALGTIAVQTGGREEFPIRGLRGFPIVDVIAGGGRPSTSYLIYKMLGDEHIQGDPMPPEGADLREIELVADWILAGAPTR